MSSLSPPSLSSSAFSSPVVPARTSQSPTNSNTILITDLQDPAIFTADNLQKIKDVISSSASIHTWTPLKSFRRIVVSFFDPDTAARMKNILDGEPFMGQAVKVYFGQNTAIEEAKDTHLSLPDAGKLFLISPPPSPPHGWEVKMEDAPNKLVHAEDLADALSKLHHRSRAHFSESPSTAGARSRSLSPSSYHTIYHPAHHGDNPDLPIIAVEDFGDEYQANEMYIDAKPIMTHTARPPVELME